MNYDVVYDPNSNFKEGVKSKQKEFLDIRNIIEDFELVQRWKEKNFPFNDLELVKKIKSGKTLSKIVYEKIFEQLRKNEKLFSTSIGGRGEVRKELYLPHLGQFIALDAFIRRGEESFTHRHRAIREIYKIEYGELTFVDSEGIYRLQEGDIIIFEKGNAHTFIMDDEYAVISVIKDFDQVMNSILELKMSVKMDWYAACEQVPRRDIIGLREKRKYYKKVIHKLNTFYKQTMKDSIIKN